MQAHAHSTFDLVHVLQRYWYGTDNISQHMMSLLGCEEMEGNAVSYLSQL